MTTDKDKGLVGLASDRLRETSGGLRGEGPWHSAKSEVYHKNRNRQIGKQHRAREHRTGERRQAALRGVQTAQQLGGPVGNLTNL